MERDLPQENIRTKANEPLKVLPHSAAKSLIEQPGNGNQVNTYKKHFPSVRLNNIFTGIKCQIATSS